MAPNIRRLALWPAILGASTVNGQQLYISMDGPSTRPACPVTRNPEPLYRFSQFSYTQTETYRTATSRPAPTATTTYAPAYSALSNLMPNVITTTWGSWEPNGTKATDIENSYGNAAWSHLWERANPANFTSYIPLYTTTVSPTPIPTSELVLPPPEYFPPTDCYDFPDDFIIGVAASAPQVEGAYAMEGRGPSQELGPSSLKSYTTNENYFLYKQDIERLASVGVKHYSFSISWSRILPFALAGTPVNKQALDHYNDLINFVLEKGMIPSITMTHFDTPSNFSEGGGSPLESSTNGGYGHAKFQEAFVYYGKILLTHYSDRVPFWYTFNEPFLLSADGFAFNNVIKSHARLYHFYKEEIQGTGKFGIKFNDNFGVPKNPRNASDVAAAEYFNSFYLASFCNPIYLGIDYPEAFKKTIHDYIPLTADDLAYINGTADFLGIDPYTITVVSQPRGGIEECVKTKRTLFAPICVTQEVTNIFGWNVGYASETYVYTTPKYLRTYLNYLWNTFRHPIIISEFGFPVYGENDKKIKDQLYDTPRSQYYLSFMSEVLKSIHEDNVHVAGAIAWSFIDNWEFGSYRPQFGLQYVNRTTQERKFKKSLFDLLDFVNTRQRQD